MRDRWRSSILGGVLLAAAAAASFGVTTPLIARYARGVGTLTTAGLLYAGAALASGALGALLPRSGRALERAQSTRLLAVAFFGAGLAPALFVWGLARSSALAASLALNAEAVFTLLLARLVYREPLGGRVLVATLAMTLGGVLLAADQALASPAKLVGIAAVLLATACWALDNTLTRGFREVDPALLVLAKSALGAPLLLLSSGVANEPRPRPAELCVLLACGMTGYGLSLRLYLLAQRRIGAARTASVFAAGPFLGAALGWLLGEASGGWLSVASAAAFACGVYLHASERHQHAHRHPALAHAHAHRHDDGHHDHEHHPAVPGEHTHEHHHDVIEHVHEHAPDLHHDHDHDHDHDHEAAEPNPGVSSTKAPSVRRRAH